MPVALSHAPLTGKHVLIIDPYEASRSVLRATVAKLGCRNFATTGSYADAMRRLIASGKELDLIFCEYNLNGPRDGQGLLEEVRSRHVISLATAFFIVTGESSQGRVVAAAEFSPDDYLIKPYSVEVLRKRVLRCLARKAILNSIHTRIEAGDAQGAVNECLRIANAHIEFATECKRLATEQLVELRQFARAEELLNEILQTKQVPWAQFSLARLRMREGKLEEAMTMLENLLRDNPQFLRVHDAIAEIKMKLGRPDEALQVLEQAVVLSSGNVARLRRVGEVSEAMGDMTKAEQAYGKVLQRTRDSSMLSGEDYANMSRTLVAQGKFEEAGQLAGDQQRTMKGHKDLELSSAMLEFHRTLRTDLRKVPDAINQLLEIEERDTEGEISPRLTAQVVRACLEIGWDDVGIGLAGKLAKRAELPPEVLQEVQEMLDQHRANREKPLPLPEIQAAIEKIVEGGFDLALARKIERSLLVLGRTLDPDQLDHSHRRWAGAKIKYGMGG